MWVTWKRRLRELWLLRFVGEIIIHHASARVWILEVLTRSYTYNLMMRCILHTMIRHIRTWDVNINLIYGLVRRLPYNFGKWILRVSFESQFIWFEIYLGKNIFLNFIIFLYATFDDNLLYNWLQYQYFLTNHSLNYSFIICPLLQPILHNFVA